MFHIRQAEDTAKVPMANAEPPKQDKGRRERQTKAWMRDSILD